MESIFEHTGKELNWVGVKQSGFVLMDVQASIAELMVQGIFGSNAEGKCADGSWKFNRVGMLKNGISVQESSGGKQMAVFKKNFSNPNGILEIIGGKKYTVKRNQLMTEYDLLDEKELLISYRYPQGTVFIHPSAAKLSEMPLMVIFLGYLVIMQRIDASSA
jgi:hypothetical protein